MANEETPELKPMHCFEQAAEELKVGGDIDKAAQWRLLGDSISRHQETYD